MRRRIVYTLAASLAVGFLVGTTWNAAFQAIPAGTDLASDLDTFITDLKREIANRASVETIFGIGSDDNGLARVGSARGFIQNAAPTDIVGPGQYNSPATAFGGTLLSTEELGASTDDIGRGRFWVDLDGLNTGITSDDRQLNVWDETTNAFVAVRAEGTGAQQLGENLIYNGSFEITDGTGLLASTTVASGWTNLNTATIAYDSVNDSTEGDGVAMETIAAGGANEGASQTLAGLKESTLYTVRARVRPVVGTCDLQVTGGAATVTDTSAAASGVFETLEVTPTTTAVPADLIVRLESNLAGDECDWDHVTIFEQRAVVAPAGIQVASESRATSAALPNAPAGAPNPVLTRAVTIPSAGYIVEVDAQISLEHSAASGAAASGAAILEEDCGGGAVTRSTQPCGATANVAGTADLCSVVLRHVNTAPTPGTTCTYTVRAFEVGSADMLIDPLSGGVQFSSHLQVKLLPTR